MKGTEGKYLYLVSDFQKLLFTDSYRNSTL